MTVVLLDPRRPTLIPLEAVRLLAEPVEFTEEVPIRLGWVLPDARPVGAAARADVLIATDRSHPEVLARTQSGEQVIDVPALPGDGLIAAVDLMDRLRVAGPWESEQTHDSLRRYLLEETYELLDAVHNGDRVGLREELGDVLLQVLFHARIAADAADDPFTIDDVAQALVDKLIHRTPTVLGGGPLDLETQLREWDERKASEKKRDSCVDGIAMAQPALALAQKVLDRVRKAGLPSDLVPEQLKSIRIDDPDVDAEDSLRTSTLQFVGRIRAAEAAASAAGYERAPLSEPQWREYWD